MFQSSSNTVVILVLSTCMLTEVSSLGYNELRSFGVSCYPKDSCHSRRFRPTQSDAEEGKTCECDVTCSRRGTCCIDSPYVDPRPSTRNEICEGERIIGVGHYYYFNYTGSYSFFQVTKCDRRWNGPAQVKELCEMKEPVDGVDFMVALPVTNTYSGVSYKNYFCALCNNDLEGSVLWDVSIYEDGNYSSLISDRFSVQASDDSNNIAGGTGRCSDRSTFPLVYSEEVRFYGYWDYCSSDTPRFVYVEVALTIPKEIEPYVKGCRTNLVSQCPPGWTNIRDKLKCGAYLGIIRGPEIIEGDRNSRQYFRNVHCAVCNNVTRFEGFSCEPFSLGALIITPTFPTSFTVLFGHMLSDEGCLGGNERFVNGLGCRAVVCANPRHKVNNGRCAPS